VGKHSRKNKRPNGVTVLTAHVHRPEAAEVGTRPVTKFRDGSMLYTTLCGEFRRVPAEDMERAAREGSP